ncbi:alanine racemase [Streptomyces sp. NBC_01187]|uniref:alanine racemase n=1 Tax=Streptomyces sp. NBC_01187 TaxID=2903766 RepID=UPI0038697B37|nr:amino acid deaminase [Streptomyces sp. NBC_01187]
MAALDDAVARLADEPADHRFKGLPPDAAVSGTTLGGLAAERRSLFTGGFTSPVLALSAERLEHNLATLAGYAARHGLTFAPHSKTHMAPQLIARQLAGGAWGVTLAVPHQVRVARAFGVQRILLANELVDAAALRWLADELDRDPDFRFVCYVDSPRGVSLMDEALRAAGARRPLDVVVELGAGEGARTGARTEAECAALADAVAATGTLRLVGVAGYEGEVPGPTLENVGAWLERLTALAVTFDKAGRFAGLDEIMVSAGGSAWFDAVADAFAGIPALSAPTLKLLRSGAYVSHDDGHYREVTPFNRRPEEGGLQAAFTLWTQVISRPEPGQAFANAGKRDAAYDLELPVPRVVRGLDGSTRSAQGITVASLSDQHAWLHVDEGVTLDVGDWIGLALSHPCTIFDKWKAIPLVEADGTVVDVIHTFF